VVGKRKPGKGQNMKFNEKRTLVQHVYKSNMTKHVSTSHISGRNWVHPEREDDARRHHNGPEAHRTIDTLTMINFTLCTRSWIYVWYYGGGIGIVVLVVLVVLPMLTSWLRK
jgi:hypothetical protein